MATLLTIRASSCSLSLAPVGVLDIVIGYMQCNIWMVQNGDGKSPGSLIRYDVCSQEYVTTEIGIPIVEACIVSGRIILLKEGTLIGPSVSLSGGDVQIHDIPVTRKQVGIVPFNDSIYLIGGLKGRKGKRTRRCEKYNVLTKTLTRLNLLDHPTLSAAAVAYNGSLQTFPMISTVHNGLIYVFSGLGQRIDRSDVYDPVEDKWTPIGYPSGGYRPSACITVGDNIFVFSELGANIYCYGNLVWKQSFLGALAPSSAGSSHTPETKTWSIYNTQCIVPGLRCVYYNDGTMYLLGKTVQKEIPNFTRNERALYDLEKPITFPSDTIIVVQ